MLTGVDQGFSVALGLEGVPVADPGDEGSSPPTLSPVKISPNKDGHQRRRSHRFYVSWSPPNSAAGSATGC